MLWSSLRRGMGGQGSRRDACRGSDGEGEGMERREGNGQGFMYLGIHAVILRRLNIRSFSTCVFTADRM